MEKQDIILIILTIFIIILGLFIFKVILPNPIEEIPQNPIQPDIEVPLIP